MAELQTSVEKGGLASLNVSLYRLAAQLLYIAECINNDPESTWLDLESFKAGIIQSSFFLFAIDLRKIKSVVDNNILIRTSL